LLLAAEAREIRVPGLGEAPRRQREIPLLPRLTEADREAHRAFVLTLGDKPIWSDFCPVPAIELSST
jgi:DNA polymerase-3 subunit epsilon